jgi:hypothetical protein
MMSVPEHTHAIINGRHATRTVLVMTSSERRVRGILKVWIDEEESQPLFYTKHIDADTIPSSN